MWKGISIIKATGSKTFDGICSKAFAFVSKQNLLLFYLLVLVFTRDVSSLKILSYTIDQKMKIDQKHWIFCSFWSKSLNLLPHIDKKSLNILLLLIKIIEYFAPIDQNHHLHHSTNKRPQSSPVELAVSNRRHNARLIANV